MSVVTVALLHPGQMGAAVAAAFRRPQVRVLWCPEGRRPDTVRRAAAAGLEPVAGLDRLLAQSDVVLSVCPPAAALDVAGQVAGHGFTGLFVDANAVSPARYAQVAARVAEGGARALDGSLFGPRWPEDPVRLYLAGDPVDAALVDGLFDGPGLSVVRIDGAAGRASGLKMAHSTFQKSARVLAALSHALADRIGVADHLRDEAAGLESALAQPELLPGVAVRAWRWAPEMHEVAAELAEHGLPPGVAVAAAEVLGRWERDRDAEDLTVAEVLDHLRDP